MSRRLFSQGPYAGSESNYQTNKWILGPVVAACVGVFGAWTYARYPPFDERKTVVRDFLQRNFIVSSNDLKMGKYQTLIGSALSHINPMHLLFNMMALHAVTRPILTLPTNLFAGLMLGTAISGSLGFIEHANSRWLTNRHGLGASGMVSGIGVATSMLVPRTSVLLFAVLPMPLWVATAGYILFDLYYLDDPTARIGHSGHLGGAAFGAAFYMVFLRRFGGVFGKF